MFTDNELEVMKRLFLEARLFFEGDCDRKNDPFVLKPTIENLVLANSIVQAAKPSSVVAEITEEGILLEIKHIINYFEKRCEELLEKSGKRS